MRFSVCICMIELSLLCVAYAWRTSSSHYACTFLVDLVLEVCIPCTYPILFPMEDHLELPVTYSAASLNWFAKLVSMMLDAVRTCFLVLPLWGRMMRDAVQTLLSVSLLWGYLTQRAIKLRPLPGVPCLLMMYPRSAMILSVVAILIAVQIRCSFLVRGHDVKIAK
jgi:hypothetical protein